MNRLARLAALWRRSLQFRVVVVTLALGTLVVGVVGTYLYGQIGTGLVEDRRSIATAESLTLTKRAQVGFYATDLAQSQQAVTEAAVSIVQEAAGTEGNRFVVLARLDSNRSAVLVPVVVSGELGLSDVPDALRQQVAADRTVQHAQLVSVRLATEPDPVPAWVVGQQVDLPLAGGYGMYYIYPMERERDSLAVVGRTFLYGGLVLLLLIGAVAYVVTRLVVAPVRSAAQVAERLASGRLDERMVAHGEDDLSSLATSFNEMADGLQRQIGQLEHLSQVQQRFVSDVSHELRTPLTTIRMAADVLHARRGEFDPAASRSAELLHNELDRFEALLSDLLEISRFDAGAAVLDTELVDLRRTVARVVDASQALAERKGSRVTTLDPGAPCEAEYDSRRVERILRNLLVNAIEHGEGQPIEIAVGADADAVAVTVRDHGIGLRPGEAAMVFNRFWRADPARARTSGGTGLGLAISLEDARLHAGWLQAWGATGQGSCFRLTLPRHADVTLERSPLPLAPGGDSPEVTPVAAEVP
ncbi:MAG: MtrAB system histidine kinase MtrB [Dermatophilaceae bacterium]